MSTHHPVQVGHIVSDGYKGQYITCACQADEWGEGPTIPVKDYPAHLFKERTMSEYVPSMDEMRAAWMVAGPPSQTVVRALQFERGIDAHDRQVKAEAWDEGAAAPRMEDGSEEPVEDNPYRIESQETP